MNLDLHGFNFPNDQARLVWNGILETNQFSGGFFMSNEEGNDEYKDLPCNTILGHLNVTESSSIFLWMDCGLFVLNTKTRECKPVLRGDCLNFTNPIQAQYKTDECGNIELYWTEDFNVDSQCCSDIVIPGNKDRYLIIDADCKPLSQFVEEIDDPDNPGNTITVADCCKIEMGLCYECPTISASVSNIGGSLATGIYQFLVQVHDNKNFSRWCVPTNPISIANENYENFDCFAGAPPGEQSRNSINLNIGEITEPFFNLAVIRTINGIVTVYVVGEYSSQGVSQTITYTGDHLRAIPIEELLTPPISYEWSATIERYNNKILKAGVCDRRNIDYQRYANQIRTSVCTIKVPTDASYNLPKNVIEIKSAMRDEVYSGAIRWVFCDGTKSEYFHIPGPTKEEVQECIDNSPDPGSEIIIDSCLSNLSGELSCVPLGNLGNLLTITGTLNINIVVTNVTTTIGNLTQSGFNSGNNGNFSIPIENVDCDNGDSGIITLDIEIDGQPWPDSIEISVGIAAGDQALSISYNEGVCESIIDTFSGSSIWNNFQNHLEETFENDWFIDVDHDHTFDICATVPACHPDNFIGCDAPVWEIYNTACITGKPHEETTITVECGEREIEIRPWECATLAYWESTDHIYPEIEVPCKLDEEGNPLLMYGNLTGQPVRYWKMPDTRLMCHFSSDIPSIPIGQDGLHINTESGNWFNPNGGNQQYTYNTDLIPGNDTYPGQGFISPVEISSDEDDTEHFPHGSVQKPYENSYVYPMLLMFENITVPDELGECKDIVGYEISITERTEFNKSVMAKGTTHNTFAVDTGSDFYATPMHAINSSFFYDHTMQRGPDNFDETNPSTLLSTPTALDAHFNSTNTEGFPNPDEMYSQYPDGDNPDDINTRACLYVDAKIIHSPNYHFKDSAIQGDYIKVEKNLCGGGVFYGNVEGSNFGTRLNFNLYHPIRPNTHNLHRRLSGIQNVPANSIVNNVIGITYPLMNVARESSVYFEIDKNPCGSEDQCVYPLKLPRCVQLPMNIGAWSTYYTDAGDTGGDNNAFSIRALQVDPIVTEVTDQSFIWFYHAVNGACTGEWLEAAKQIRRIGTHYVSVKRYLKNQYGGINNQVYKSCIAEGKIRYGDDGTPYVDDKEFVGVDSFINYWSYLRTARFTDIISAADTSEVQFGHSGWNPCGANQPEFSSVVNSLVHSWFESDINVSYRYDDPANDCYFYPHSICKNELNLDPSFDPTATYDNSFLTLTYAVQTEGQNSDRIQVKQGIDNCKLYNLDYSRTNPYCGGAAIGLDYDVCCLNCFPTRVIWSESQVLTSIENSWRTFLAGNFIDLPKHTGNITRLINFGNEIYAHMTEALWRLQATQQQLNLGSETVLVGSGDLFSQTPVQLYVTSEGYGGLQFREASIKNEYGYFWVDAAADKIHHLEGQGKIQEISNLGLRNFFKEYRLSSYTLNRPFLFGFDKRHNRLMFTKRDEFTLSYMPDKKEWVSFHSYLPDYYLQDRLEMWTSKNEKLWIHNRTCESFHTYYGEEFPFILEIIINPKYQIDLESLYVIFESYKYIAPQDIGNYPILLYDQGQGRCNNCVSTKDFYDELHIYNYCQSTGILPIHIKETGSDAEEIRQAITASNDCSRWDISGWRDAKCDNLCPYPRYPFLLNVEDLSYTETEQSFTENNTTMSCNYNTVRFILNKNDTRIYHLGHTAHQFNQQTNNNEREG